MHEDSSRLAAVVLAMSLGTIGFDGAIFAGSLAIGIAAGLARLIRDWREALGHTVY